MLWVMTIPDPQPRIDFWFWWRRFTQNYCWRLSDDTRQRLLNNAIACLKDEMLAARRRVDAGNRLEPVEPRAFLRLYYPWLSERDVQRVVDILQPGIVPERAEAKLVVVQDEQTAAH